MRIGYFLSSEEYTPAELIEQAKGAERAGFSALWISDHYHPWVDAQHHEGLFDLYASSVLPKLHR